MTFLSEIVLRLKIIKLDHSDIVSVYVFAVGLLLLGVFETNVLFFFL